MRRTPQPEFRRLLEGAEGFGLAEASQVGRARSLATHKRRRFADEKAWTRHLKRLGIVDLPVTPDPVRVATESLPRRRPGGRCGVR